MSKTLKRLAIAAVLVCMFGAGSAAAIVVGPSNFGFVGYPDHRCYEPRMPYSDDEFELDRFRRAAREYATCIDDYVNAGNYDMQRIRESQQEALDEADAFVSRIRRY